MLAQFLTEIALPLLFAAIDALMCLLDYFKPSGWNDQLACVEARCFKGPDAAADLLTFFSMPIIIGRFTAIMDATLNSRSGKRFFKAPKAGDADGQKAYLTRLETLHGILVSTMKAKQTVDPAHAAKLRELIDKFKHQYFSPEDLEHMAHEH